METSSPKISHQKRRGPLKYKTDTERIEGQKRIQHEYYLRNRQKYLDRGKEQYLQKMKDHEYVNKSKYAAINKNDEDEESLDKS